MDDFSGYFEEFLEQHEVVKTCVYEDSAHVEKATQWETDIRKTYDQLKEEVKAYLKAREYAPATQYVSSNA